MIILYIEAKDVVYAKYLNRYIVRREHASLVYLFIDKSFFVFFLFVGLINNKKNVYDI